MPISSIELVQDSAEHRNQVVILDCTIRDGSYAIDFKFSPGDSALVAGLLDQLGIPYIEICHGLGLGAGGSERRPARLRDVLEVERARECVKHAKLGAFFIPGVGERDDIDAAAAAGLDFIRIGQNADETDTIWGYVDHARDAGLEVFVNLMKTYGISTDAFAHCAVESGQHGVAGLYVVDSSGGMLPDEVAAYVEAALERSATPIGFHGHNNLHLGVANALRALEAGATFVDTSLYGIGRSSGNVPTEVFIALLDRLGINVGIDPFDVIEVAERYVKPLAEHLQPHTMTSVALGFGRFHSSYLPQALEAAEHAGISPFRLIVELGRRDMMRLPDDVLSAVVKELEDVPAPTSDVALASFSHPAFGPRSIRTGASAVADLVDGLEAVAAKRRLQVVLDLAQSSALDEETVSAEFVLEDRFMAMGRLRFGSLNGILSSLELLSERVDVVLLDVESLDQPASRLIDTLRAADLEFPVLPYRGSDLMLGYLGDVALARITRDGTTDVSVHDPGRYDSAEVDTLARRLRSSAERVSRTEPGALAIVAGPPATVSDEILADAEAIISLGTEAFDDVLRPPHLTVLAPDDAYRDRLPAWQKALAAARTEVSAQ